MKMLLGWKEKRDRPPEAFAQHVDLPAHLEPVVSAFWSLCGDRHGQGPIGFLAIDAYARRIGLVGDAFARFERRIRSLDGAYLEHMADMRRAAEAEAEARAKAGQ